jgi:acyl carrier protein
MGSLGRRNMNEFVEPHVRRLVAERLGVGVEELVSDVSLRDDLAADSLDLVELAMALEGEFAIVVPERILDEVRTYSDLVHTTSLLIRARCEAEARGAEPPDRIWVRIVPAGGESSGTLERTGWLTPYTAETIAEDAVAAGRGASLEVKVAASATAGLARVQHQFARLGARGVQVTVRHDDRPAGPPVDSTADRVAERHQVAAAGAEPPLTHRLLDQLTGARTTVTVTGYEGDDPWQADDLIASVGQDAKRFGDATPTEQKQALSGSGPSQFLEGGPPRCEYRATAEGHHVHAHFDQPHCATPDATREVIGKTSIHLDIGPGIVRNERYYRTDLCTEVGPRGELLTREGATYYVREPGQRSFAIASCLTRPTPARYRAGCEQGLRAQFDLSAPSPNGFRARTATLDCATDDCACTLFIVVSAQVAGTEQFAQVTLRRGAETTMDVHRLPLMSSSDVGLLASP